LTAAVAAVCNRHAKSELAIAIFRDMISYESPSVSEFSGTDAGWMSNQFATP
jgi:hypothetical protein